MSGELYPGEFEAMEHNGRMDALEQEPCPDAISRQAVIDEIEFFQINPQHFDFVSLIDSIKDLPPVNPQPKTGYISIDDVMSVFDDFMRGEADEDGTDTFLKMLKDRAESEGEQNV